MCGSLLPAPIVQFYPDGSARVSISYDGARIPFPYMNTAQALVTDLFGLEFQVLLQHRLERNFRAAGIPYGSIDFHALRSADYGDDERYTVSMRVAPENLHNTMRLMSNTIAEMEATGVGTEEYAEAKKVLMPAIYRKWVSKPAPGSLVNRCIAHFLYGANLAPYDETVRLFSRKNVSDSVETRLFNRFADALLEQLSNLTLEYRQAPDSLDKDEELFYYNLSYLYGSVVKSGNDYRWHGGDTLGMQANCPKVRVKSERVEPVSGGTSWTFSNGMRVIFKQVPKTGIFNYELQLGGGLAQIGDLQEGEGGYIGDLLSLYDAAGLPAWHFREVLEVSGVSMDTHVDLNNMAVSGVAPSSQLPLLLKALLELANYGKLNRDAYEAYRNSSVCGDTELGRCPAPSFLARLSLYGCAHSVGPGCPNLGKGGEIFCRPFLAHERRRTYPFRRPRPGQRKKAPLPVSGRVPRTQGRDAPPDSVVQPPHGYAHRH